MEDIAIVGAGFAGLVAARRAQQLGARTLLVERSSQIPGESNARLSGGIIHVAARDPLRRSPAELLDAIMTVTEGGADPVLARAVADHSARLLSWLRHEGVTFTSDSPPEYREQVLAPGMPAGPGYRWVGRGPQRSMSLLAQAFRADGGQVLQGRRVTGLNRTAAGDYTLVLDPGDSMVPTARAVILADGGFHSDSTALERLGGVSHANVCRRGSETSLGDGIRLAQFMGAELVKTYYLYGHCLSRDARDNAKLVPYPWLDPLVVHGMVVASNGQRVGWPGLNGNGYANVIAHAPGELGAWAVCDEDCWSGPATAGGIPANPLLPELGGTLLRADSLAALAARIGLEPAVLEEAVVEHNKLAKGAGSALARPPFYAAPVIAGITNTLGGLRVDGAARVQTADGQTIPGLYAAGASAGGLQGSPSGGYVGGLAEAGVLGLLAAEDAISRIGS